MGLRGSEILWRIVSSVFSYPQEGEIVELPNGFRMMFRRNEWTSISIYKGQYEIEIQQVLSRIHYQNAKVILDVGANLGWTSYCMGQKREGIDSIHLFEPISEIAQFIKHSLKNLTPTPVVHNIALSDFSGLARIFYSNMEKHNGLATLRTGLDQRVFQDRWVTVDTLDNLTVNFQDKIAVLKIDAEGSEMKILLGAKNLIERNPPLNIILEFTRQFYHDSDLIAMREILKKYRCFSLSCEGKFRRKLKLREINYERLDLARQQQNILLTLMQPELSE